MTEKYLNKYRINSTRLQKWDYGWNAPYFVTICTKHRENYFGHNIKGVMHLSEIGRIVEREWLKTIELRPDMNLQLGEFVVMPDHFHGIIIIGDNIFNSGSGMKYGKEDEMKRGAEYGTVRTGAMHCASNPNRSDEIPCDSPTPTLKNQFGPQSKNLASIIRGFKSAVTINARRIQHDFAWQPRFHDHIIRDMKAHKNIETYIIQNPIKWADNKL